MAQRARIDQQGRVVVPRSIRQRLGIDGRAGELVLEETGNGVLLEVPSPPASVVDADDGLPAITIDDRASPVTTADVLRAIDQQRAER